ncbi:hypothetical protein V1293_003294 [Bradyrhizobium sp. AZCC 1693]
MLLPTQSAWQESSASRQLSGDPIPIQGEVSKGGAMAQHLFVKDPAKAKQREDHQ